MTYATSTTTFLASSNYDSSLSREVGYLDDMDYDLRVPGEILTVEVYNDYEIACLTSFGAIFVMVMREVFTILLKSMIEPHF